MNAPEFLQTAWSWNPWVILLSAIALIAYFAEFGWNRRIWFLFAAILVLLVALVSPLNALAQGYLFSAHMAQHILLLLVVPALALWSLPPNLVFGPITQRVLNPFLGWLAGVGAMWFWHIPALCNATAARPSIFAVQTASLLLMGVAFWAPVLAPNESQRIGPLTGVIYLFSACTACTVLGIILTFAPVGVCSAYLQPVDRLGILSTLRQGWGMTPERDQQAGGLLMWVPMCLIYLAGIFAQLARWYGAAGGELAPVKTQTTAS